MIFVFLSNKLITLDTVLPLLLELRQRAPGLRFEFFCFEPNTENAIRKNLVLHDALTSLGPLRMLGRRGKGLWQSVVHRIWATGVLARVALWLCHPKSRAIHFKALNAWPLKTLSWLAPAKIFLVQPSAIGYAPLEKKASELMKPRKYAKAEPVGRHIVEFNEHWPLLVDKNLSRSTVYRMPPPFTLTSWLDYLKRKESHYLAPVLGSAGLDGDAEFGVYILSWLGPCNLLKNPDELPVLLAETLRVLGRASPSMPILVKPHPSMRPHELEELEQLLAGIPECNTVVTYLHPMLLAQRARFAIANIYSTTFSVFNFCGVPTVEYSDYAPHIFEETAGGSMRPEFVSYFVNRDQNHLAKAVGSIMAAPKPAPAASLRTIPDHLLRELAGLPQNGDAPSLSATKKIVGVD